MRRLYLVGFPLLECRTPWFDRDDPSGLGDNETLSLLLIRYPLQVCTQPIAIEVTTISGTPFFFSVLYSSACVTRWFDSDDPETNGRDSELLSGLFSKYPGYICPNPIGIEVQTISGQPAYQTGNIFQVYNPVFGFACVNAGQTGGGLCADYKVRFSCPEKFCTSCRTSWFDRDDPDDPGDSEILTDIQIIIPPKVCSLPIAIEVTTISGSPALLTGNLFQLFDPLLGFKCVNEQQGGGVCQDYKVCYTCPKSFCKIQVLSNLTIEAANILDKY
uniref:WxxW domain-containing protein n=1 Tax=Sinocyclocheilus rhinocerous TaxID=307959 RepID=A0A673MUM8_9TELE